MIPQHGTLEISESRFCQNVDLLRRKLPPGTRICATIKANAYGHSCRHLQALFPKAGIEWHCTYTVEEAMETLAPATLSRDAPKVLVLSPLIGNPQVPEGLSHNLLPAVQKCIRFTLVDMPSAEFLDGIAGAAKLMHKPPIHVQVDTGLTRGGVAADEAPDFLRRILELPNLRLEGIFTHLSHGDSAGHHSIAEQIRTLHQIADPVKRDHPEILIHAQNSGGTWHFADASLDMVRIGIALYGLQPSLDDPIPGLLPIARLIAPILMIHDRPANTGIGYGHTFITQRISRLAVIPVGYADGYPRSLSNRGIVQVRGQNAPVVGRVSMDQIIVDVTDIPAATAGDEVTVFSNDPAAPNCIDQIAKACGTIGYEIATGMGPRLDRRVVE